TTEEIADDRAERLRIDQLLRRHSIDIDVEQSHAFLDQSLGPSQTDPALIGEQFAHGSYPPASEMIDVIERALAAAQINQVFDRGDEISVGQNAFAQIDVDPQFLIQFVAANAAEIVFLGIKKEPLE